MRSATLAFAMAWPTLMAWLYFMAAARPTTESGGPPNLLMQALYGGGKVVQFALPLLCYAAWERRWPRLAAPSFRGVEYGVGFGLLVGAGILGLYFIVLRSSPLLRGTPAQLEAKLRDMGLATPAGYLLLAVFLSVIHSLLEEYYWRWFVFSWLRRSIPRVAAMVLSSLAFMAHHVVILAVFFPGRFWTAAVPCALAIAGGGFVWAWLYDRTNSIYAPWLSHLLIDAAIMGVGYDMLFVRGE
jgi:membrane protease YdiL (CAAX protease family)